MIGFVGTNRPSPQGLEFGYCFKYEYWGKGYATEAARMFLDIYWGLESRFSVSFRLFKGGFEEGGA
jgi:RimJ/RimL family protein N-acetyltransferase